MAIRDTQKDQSRPRRLAAVAASTTAAALTFGVGAPAANAADTPASDCGGSETELCVAMPAVATGGLMGGLNLLLNLTGGNPLFLSKPNNLGFDITNRPWPTTLFNAVNDQPYVKQGETGSWACGGDIAPADSANCRQTVILSYGFGAMRLANAQRELYAAAEKGTLKSPGNSLPGTTAMVTFAVNNVLNPDGGLLTRFATILGKLGIDTSLQPTGTVDPATPTATNLSNWLYSFSTPYNPLSDFPVTLNPFSLINSVLGNIPPINDLISQYSADVEGTKMPPTGVWYNAAGTMVADAYGLRTSSPARTQYEDGVNTVAYNVATDNAGVFGGILNALSTEQDPLWNPVFETLAATNYLPLTPKGNPCPNEGGCPQNTALPILYPTELLGAVVNPLLKKFNSPYLLGNPLADVLGPALRILVNIGYNDVVTPEMLSSTETGSIGPTGKTYADLGYHAYDRTFYQITTEDGGPVEFSWSKNPSMTAEQTKEAYGAAMQAFKSSLKAQSEKPMFGILVKNPATQTPTPAAPVAARTAAPVSTVAAAPKAPSAAAVSPARATAGKAKPAQAKAGLRASRTAK